MLSDGKLRLEYDPSLPISAHRTEILEALARHPVIVVCGATGSGKSTQLPKLCLEAGRGSGGLIGHTQPRRIAARALAARLAAELGTTVAVPGKRADAGGLVGYKVRFNDRTGPGTRVKLMTDGILLKELESDRSLRRYDTLIIDEAHERSLNIDLILGVLKQLAPRRPDLRTIVTSATIDPGRFAEFFGGAPVIEVSGRSYPVEVRYRPLNRPAKSRATRHTASAAGQDARSPGSSVTAADEAAPVMSLPEGIVAAVRELDRDAGTRGDVLVFLPGEKQIREAAHELQKAKLLHTEVLPLFARLSTRDQQRIFTPHGQRRVVLATNVAETSLTVPGIRYVIDSGLARISRYSPRAKVQRLPIEPISQASADQRKGRCGREAPGVCIRLYAEDEFTEREAFTPPEVLRTNLASVILRMAVVGLGTPETFPFLDPPDMRLVNDGVRLLQELKAMDADRQVTGLGARISGLPVDPRLGRMLLAAAHHACVTEMLVVTSFLEAQDPRERPADAQQQAAEKHAAFADARSDFMTILNLWRAFRERSQALSGSQLRKWCREQFVSFVRLREWQELHSQLAQGLAELKLRPNPESASYAGLHQAILTGFLGSIGCLDERREYDGPRGVRFVIAPGTPMASKPPKWVVAGSLTETTRLYARMVAAVDPGWIESAGSHLVKRTYTEPHWVAGRGFVAALESVSLYGLPLAAGRRVNYGAIAPLEARAIFIQEALMAGNAHLRGEFLQVNRRLRAQIEDLEAKIRRRDILADDRALLDFYARRIPERVSSVSAFEQWRARAERANPQLLHMSRADLMQREAPEAGPDRFPDDWALGANRLPLHYRFEPAQSDDGVTLIVPEPLVELLDADQLAWLVPGLLLEKIIAVLRELPKGLRKQLVPVPDHARTALVEKDVSRGFFDWLSHWITARTGVVVSAAELAALPLPAHLVMNVRVVDADDRTLTEGRDLLAIKRKTRSLDVSARRTVAQAPSNASQVHREWDFPPLPETLEVERNRLKLIVYPALEDRGAGVALTEARTLAEADTMSRNGIIRLALLALPQQVKYLNKLIADDRELVLLSRGLPIAGSIAESLTRRAFGECFVPLELPWPRSANDFKDLLDSRRQMLTDVAERLMELITNVFREWRAVRTALSGVGSPGFATAVADVQAQLQSLLPPDFIESVPRPWLDQLPRYLRAVVRRLERLPANSRRDSELAAQLRPFVSAFQGLAGQAVRTAQPELRQLRWMIEEFRVSLFAQELKTVMRVSDKRLAQQVEAARAEART